MAFRGYKTKANNKRFFQSGNKLKIAFSTPSKKRISMHCSKKEINLKETT